MPSQSNQILTTPLHAFIAHIKVSYATATLEEMPLPDTVYRTRTVFQMELINIQVNSSPILQVSCDPQSSFSVYSVFPSSLLSFTMEKLLASELLSLPIQSLHILILFKLANAHRVFVTKELITASAVMSPSAHSNLTGIVSIVDSAFLFFFYVLPQKIKKLDALFLTLFFFGRIVLSLFARIAKIPNIDPTQMQRHRRASSASTSERGLSRSSSTTSIRQSPNILASSPTSLSPLESARNSSVSAITLDPLVGSQRKEKRRSVIF